MRRFSKYFICLSLLYFPSISAVETRKNLPSWIDSRLNFLSGQPFQVVRLEDGTPEIPKGATSDERYRVRNESGTFWILHLRDPIPLIAALEVDALLPYLGLADSDIRPVIVRRGLYSIPFEAEADSFFPNRRFPALGNGLWMQGILHADASPVSSDWRESFSQEQRADAISFAMIHYVLGRAKFLPEEEILEGHDRIRLRPFVSAFRDMSKESDGELSKVFEEFPYDWFVDSGLNGGRDFLKFLNRLNQIVSRFEKLTAGDIDALFGPYFESIAHRNRIRSMEVFPFRDEMLRRIQKLRPALSSHFKERRAAPRRLAELSQPISVLEPPSFEHSNLRISNDFVPVAGQHRDMDLALAYFMQPDRSLRNKAARQWNSEVGWAERIFAPKFGESFLKASCVRMIPHLHSKLLSHP